jgi:hypothetical protein
MGFIGKKTERTFSKHSVKRLDFKGWFLSIPLQKPGTRRHCSFITAFGGFKSSGVAEFNTDYPATEGSGYGQCTGAVTGCQVNNPIVLFQVH